MALSTSCRIRNIDCDSAIYVNRCKYTHFICAHKCVTLHLHRRQHTPSHTHTPSARKYIRTGNSTISTDVYSVSLIRRTNFPSESSWALTLYALQYSRSRSLALVCERAHKRRRLCPKTKHYCRVERNFLSVKLNQHRVGHGRIGSDE